MKEIIYVQAGLFSNYIGTHFWNFQQKYLEEDADEVEHAVSFREGQTAEGAETICPRAVIFDVKENFGPLSSTTGEYVDEDYGGGGEEGMNVQYVQQPRIPPPPPTAATNPRYWSDYTQTTFHPRSLHSLPNLSEMGRGGAEEGWEEGRERFRRYDSDTGFMETAFRGFLEECDQAQGVQLIYDTRTFGGFISGFLNGMRDEVGKLDCLAFPVISMSPSVDDSYFDDAKEVRNKVKEAFCLRELNELATLSVPIWDMGLDDRAGTKHEQLDRLGLFDTSAIIASHLDNATFPLRRKNSEYDVSSLCASLSVPAGNVRFAQLSGVVPLTALTQGKKNEVEKELFNISGSPRTEDNDERQWSMTSVTRGLTDSERKIYDDWWSGPTSLVLHAPALPLPSSFPRLFSNHTSVRALSRLTTASSTGKLFSGCGEVVKECLRRDLEGGVEREDLRDLESDLRGLAEGFSEGEKWEEVEEGIGEDEDW